MEFLILIAIGVITGMIANSRGRSGLGWFCIGFLFQCLALIIVMVLPDLKVEKEKTDQLRRENRRLREQVKKDRTVADARHEATQERLAVHDRAVGVDTAQAGLLGPDQAKVRDLLGDELTSAQWYYLDADHERQGPIPFEDLDHLWRTGVLVSDTLLWTQAFEDWTALAEVPGLEGKLGG